MAGRIAAAVAGIRSPYTDQMGGFGASIGIAISDRFDDPSTMLKRADEALYQQKRNRPFTVGPTFVVHRHRTGPADDGQRI